MSISSFSHSSSRPHTGVILAAVLLTLELLALSVLYKHNFEFTCNAHAPHGLCQFAGRVVPRALGVIAGLSLFVLARRGALQSVLGARVSLATPLLINLAGFALIIAPWTILSDESAPTTMLFGAALWLVGSVATIAGLILMVAPANAWRSFFAQNGLVLSMLVAAGMLLPEFADQFGLIWQLGWITDVTFDAVVWILTAIGYEIYAIPETKVIGNADFAVEVGAPCSGVEGFALITVFLSIYFGLFRRELRFPQALLLIPIGIFVSWCFNVLRISVLIAIGFAGAPDLAVGGFHSHAGWLTFTMLAIGLILISRNVSYFQRQEPAQVLRTPEVPFLSDPMVAQILPFAVFMATALLASTFHETPSLLYPLRAAVTAGALVLIWPYLRNLPWRFDSIAALSGLAIGVLWIATSPAAEGAPPFGALTGLALAVWIAARLIGTALLVPVLEELMFRQYIQSRIAPEGSGIWRTVIAVGVATALFAVLHDRWIAAALAGLVFSALVLRSRNITDAILSHGVANLTIALWALATGAWHIL